MAISARVTIAGEPAVAPASGARYEEPAGESGART